MIKVDNEANDFDVQEAGMSEQTMETFVGIVVELLDVIMDVRHILVLILKYEHCRYSKHFFACHCNSGAYQFGN